MRTVLLFFVAALDGLQAMGNPLRTVAELNEAIFSDRTNSHSFAIRGIVLHDKSDDKINVSVFDGTNAVLLAISRFLPSNVVFHAGDELAISGHTSPHYGSPSGCATMDSFRHIGHRPPPEPIDLSAEEFHSGRLKNCLVRLTGTIRDVARDEIDPNYVFVEISSDGESVFIPLNADSDVRARFNAIVGSRVRVIGLCCPRANGSRRHMGCTLTPLNGLDSFEIIEPPPPSPFDAPNIRTLDWLRPSEISRRGWHTAEGHVLCAWNGNEVLLRTRSGRIVRVSIDGGNSPCVGSYVAIGGFPEPNLYQIDLFRARWKPLSDKPQPSVETLRVTASQLLEDSQGRDQIHLEYHGKTVRIVGTVSAMETSRRHAKGFLLACDNRPIPVIFGDGVGSKPPEPGSRVEVTGVCCVESEPWRPAQRFPQITGLALVTRTPSDLVILSTPSWWTPQRLLLALALMSLVLVGLFAWNRSLQVIATRRSRQLFREEVAHCEARFRVDERTRLAVELHDTLSQNLTGVSLKIDAALRMAASDPDKMLKNLGIASKALMSCRAELRNSLWDLRHQTLEVDNMEEAIRQTLEPHVEGIALAIRFKVPRKRISDNTAHAILCIIRELTVNAVRHGQATSVKVAGSVEGDKLLFSVKDNGCGFDPENCPNDEQGHYGLLGIRERVNAFEGTQTIASRPNEGTKVSISISIPQQT